MDFAGGAAAAASPTTPNRPRGAATSRAGPAATASAAGEGHPVPPGRGGQEVPCGADPSVPLSVCPSPASSSFQHVQEEPVPAGSRHSPMPSVAPGAWHTWVPAVPMRADFRLPNVEVEEEEDDKENIPALSNASGRAVPEEFIPWRARGAAGRCWLPRGAAGLGVLGVVVGHPEHTDP